MTLSFRQLSHLQFHMGRLFVLPHAGMTETFGQLEKTRTHALMQRHSTLAHEIGHVLILHGHPDSYNPTNIDPNDPFAHNGGVAALARDPALHERRLMASGLLRKRGIELVLDEWSEIKIQVEDIISPQE